MNFAGSLNDIAANCFIIWIGDRRISRDDTPADCAGTTPAGVLYESRRTCLCPTSNQIGFDPSISEGRFQMFNAPDESVDPVPRDRKSTRLNSSHPSISYAVFCLKKN